MTHRTVFSFLSCLLAFSFALAISACGSSDGTPAPAPPVTPPREAALHVD